MNYAEWIVKVKSILQQYDEGAIFDFEAFNAILAHASEITETPESEPEK